MAMQYDVFDGNVNIAYDPFDFLGKLTTVRVFSHEGAQATQVSIHVSHVGFISSWFDHNDMPHATVTEIFVPDDAQYDEWASHLIELLLALYGAMSFESVVFVTPEDDITLQSKLRQHDFQTTESTELYRDYITYLFEYPAA